MAFQFVLGLGKRLRMPKISVVLPVYNGAVFLKESIDSILAQSYQDFELIIVDDCSTDNTSSIAKNYANLYPNVIYHRNEVNLKLPETLNKGFALATGEYWTWTSHDNIYLQDAFQELSKALDKDSKLGFVYADMEIIDVQGQKRGYVTAGPSEDLILRNVVGACFLYRASIAKQVGLYNKNLFLCEDYEYWLRLAVKTNLEPIRKCLYQYRRHAKSLSQNFEREVIGKGIRIQKSYYPIFVKTRTKSALFYAHLRARDIYNPFRQFYLLIVLFFSPLVFLQEVAGLISRRVSFNEKD